jgi:hypothetical protein
MFDTIRGPFGDVALCVDEESEAQYRSGVGTSLPGQFDSSWLYVGPGAAEAWLGRSASAAVRGRLWTQFNAALETFMVPRLPAGRLTVVDLGPGDFTKTEQLLRGARQRGCDLGELVLVDVSREMLEWVLMRSPLSESGCLARACAQGTVRAVQARFDRLPFCGDWLGACPRVFVSFGNTLGNAPDDRAVLSALAEILDPEDVLVLELQSVQAEPRTDEELTRRFEADREWLTRPFVVAGVSPADIAIRVGTDRLDDCEATTVKCEIKRSSATIGGAPTAVDHYSVLLVRKYTERRIARLFNFAGLELVGIHRSDHSDRGGRAFFYVVGRRT